MVRPLWSDIHKVGLWRLTFVASKHKDPSMKRFLLVLLNAMGFCMTSIPAASQTIPIVGTKVTDPHLWKDSPVYAEVNSLNVMRRSTFFMPLFGSVYREKFVALLTALPSHSLRGVVIYNHGCGGQWGWETTVAQLLYRQGFAVITPDFAGREGNRLGCPGGTEAEMLAAAGERASEGVFQAINPARLAARAQEILIVAEWIKQRTSLPILIGGHSEGCRATYSLHLNDPRIVGGFCVKQGLQPFYEHTWRWNPRVPMWQSLEENDPWAVPNGVTAKDVTFERKFFEFPRNLTFVITPGRSHDPLNQDAERASLTSWLNTRVSSQLRAGQAGFNFEPVLPEIHKRLRAQ